MATVANNIRITIVGEPHPRQSVRSALAPSGKIIHYQPSNTPAARWKDKIRATCLQHKPDKLLLGAIGAVVNFYLSTPKKKRHQSPIGKPDLDNLEKPLWDAMQGVFFQDDAQIIEKTITKVYSDNPRVEVFLYECGDTE